MRFKIYGAKRDTGESTSVTIEAATAEEASSHANRHGLLVERCEPMTSRSAIAPEQLLKASVGRHPSDSGPTTPVSAKAVSGKINRYLVGGGVAVGLAALTLTALFFLKIKPEHEAVQKTLDDSVKQFDETAAKQRDIDAAEVRKATIKTKIAKRASGSLYLRLLHQLDFTEAAKGFVKQAAELRDKTRGGTLSGSESASMLAAIEESYASLKGEKLDSSDRDFFDKSVQTAIKDYHNAQNALNSASSRPELKSDYEATAASAWQEGAEQLSFALITYKSMLDDLEK